MIRILEVLFSYYLICHIFGCIWIHIGLSKPDPRLTWLNRVPVLLPEGHRISGDPILNDVSKSTIYIHGLYLITNMISHVAIGDLSSISTNERIFNSFCISIFTFLFAFCFGSMCGVVQDLLANSFLSLHTQYD